MADRNEDKRSASFTDASYIPRDQAPNLPRVYPGGEGREEKEKEKKTGKISLAGALCLCAVSVLLGAWLHASVAERGTAGTGQGPTEPTPGPTAAVTATARATATPAPEPTEVPVLSAGEIYSLACRQVVGITTGETGENAFGVATENAVAGAGCVLTEDGYILTSYRVVEDAIQNGTDIGVRLYGGDFYPAEVVGYERDVSDVAVLKIDASLTPVETGDDEEIRVGETVYTVGHPLGELTFTLTPGMISAAEQELAAGDGDSGGDATVELFQLSATGGRGSGGGPVYDQRGKVIGMVTTRYGSGAEGLGLAIPMGSTMDLARDIMENGYVRGKPYLGIIVQTVTSAVADYYNQFYEGCMVVGVQIYAMDSDAAAALAGLQRGDIITAVDGRSVRTAAELTNLEKDYRAGDQAVLTVYRGREYVELAVTFDERSPEAAAEAGW